MESGTSKILAINEPENVDAGVTSVAISPDSRIVAAGSLDMLVRLWDVQTGALIERLRGHKDSVYSVAFTPDGTRLVSGSLDKTLKYWDLSPLLSNDRWNVPLQQSVVVASNSQTPKRDGGEKGSNCTMGFVGHKDYVLSVAVSPDGGWVVSGSKDRGVQFWDPRTAQTQLMLQGHKNSVISIDLSPAGGLLATGSGDWQARVWSYTSVAQQ
jgi:glucose repression regulatory protein TUP1